MRRRWKADEARKAKVAQLEVRLAPLAAEEQVLGLQVVVDDASLVKVLQRLGHLAQQLGGSVLGEAALVGELVKELAARRELQHQRLGRRHVKLLDERDEVAVLACRFQNANLTLEILAGIGCLLLVDEFQSVRYAGGVGFSKLHRCVVALAKSATDGISRLDLIACGEARGCRATVLPIRDRRSANAEQRQAQPLERRHHRQ